MSQQYSFLHTRISSTVFPGLVLRTVQGNQDAPGWSKILSASSPDLDVAWAEGSISRQITRFNENPVVVSPDGLVASGPSGVNLVVEYEGDIIGVSGFGSIKTRDNGVRAGDAGVQLDPSYQGRGLATEAMKLSLDFGARSAAEGGLQLDVVSITTLTDNLPMIKVAERLGLSRDTAVVRAADFDKDKQEYFWEWTAGQWQAQRRQAQV